MTAEMWRDRQAKTMSELIETRDDLAALRTELDELLTIADEGDVEKAKSHRIKQLERTVRRLKVRVRVLATEPNPDNRDAACVDVENRSQ